MAVIIGGTVVGLALLGAGGAKALQVIKLSREAAANAAKYQPAIAAAERKHNLPAGMLFRLLQRESRFKTSIITGAEKSSVGAIGIAQFMPATAAQYGVNPYDPLSSIDGAGRYLSTLYATFGNWRQAVAAYNDGPHNVAKLVQKHGTDWLASAPPETRGYVAEILG